VLGTDVVVLERPRLVLREDDDLASPFSEAFEQSPSTPLSVDRRGSARMTVRRSKVEQS
jgi:hypothetical protein